MNNNLLVSPNEATCEQHANCPASQDDLVLVLLCPSESLFLGRQRLPAPRGNPLLAFNFTLSRTGPCRSVVFETTSLGLDSVEWCYDEDDSECFKGYGKVAVVGGGALEVVRNGEGDGKACADSFDCSADCGGVMSGEFFFSCKLRKSI